MVFCGAEGGREGEAGVGSAAFGAAADLFFFSFFGVDDPSVAVAPSPYFLEVD